MDLTGELIGWQGRDEISQPEMGLIGWQEVVPLGCCMLTNYGFSMRC